MHAPRPLSFVTLTLATASMSGMLLLVAGPLALTSLNFALSTLNDSYDTIRLLAAALWTVGAAALFASPLLLAKELGLPARFASLDAVGGERARRALWRAVAANAVVLVAAPVGGF